MRVRVSEWQEQGVGWEESVEGECMAVVMPLAVAAFGVIIKHSKLCLSCVFVAAVSVKPNCHCSAALGDVG